MGYNSFPMTTSGGLTAENRQMVESLHRGFPEPFTAEQAAELLRVDLGRARRLMRYLADRGWLDRVRRGLYLPVPLDAHRTGEAYKDPWVVASVAFAPAYIAGWSAAEYWDLTEQIFRDVLVVTGQRPRQRRPTMGGTTFELHSLNSKNYFGLAPAWRGSHRVEVTDPTRTIIDLLANPSWGGGIRHVSAIVEEYFASKHRKDGDLLAYGDSLGTRSVFKRLGYLIELAGVPADDLLANCLRRRSAGVNALDPTVKVGGRTLARWGLRLNVDLDADHS